TCSRRPAPLPRAPPPKNSPSTLPRSRNESLKSHPLRAVFAPSRLRGRRSSWSPFFVIAVLSPPDRLGHCCRNLSRKPLTHLPQPRRVRQRIGPELLQHPLLLAEIQRPEQ